MSEEPARPIERDDPQQGALSTSRIAGASLGAAVATTVVAMLLVAVVLGLFVATGSGDSDDGPGIFVVVGAATAGLPIGALVGALVGISLVRRDRPHG